MSELTTKDAMLERAVAALEKLKTSMDIINPVGVVQAFAGSTTPDGWLLCDGSAVSRTTYAALFSAIGTTYGAGDGTTTFNLPNLVDKFVEGSSTAGTEKTAGLPNIKGIFDPRETVGFGYNGTGTASGSFYKTTDGGSLTSNTLSVQSGNTDPYRIGFDASKSNSIYGNSTTVQPPALTMRYIIKC